MGKILTKKEMMKIINSLPNAIDRFILAGIYYGLNGKSAKEMQILHIKKTDVDFTNHTITLQNGQLFEMNSDLEKITKDAINQEIYVKMGEVGNTSEDYLLSPTSEYIVRAQPKASNNQGTNPMTLDGYKTKMKRISSCLGVKLTATDLKMAGVYMRLQAEKNNWTIREAEDFLKKSDLCIRRNNLMQMLKMLKVES